MAGSRTPDGLQTPIVRIGGNTSVYNQTKSPYYIGGGMSPGFQTPIYTYSAREFSEHRME